MTTQLKDDDRFIQDGERLRVPMLLMDELQRSVLSSRLHDGLGNAAGFKPGYVFVVANDQSPGHAARETYVKLIGDEWRNL